MHEPYSERIVINGIDAVDSKTMAYQDKDGTISPGLVGPLGGTDTRVGRSVNLGFINGSSICSDIDTKTGFRKTVNQFPIIDVSVETINLVTQKLHT